MAAQIFNLSLLNGNNGFRLDGVAAGVDSGGSVSNAGDINGDGFDDVIVGGAGSDSNGAKSGSSYVVFGKPSGFDPALDLASLDGNDGFRLDGAPGDFAGVSVSGAGDINGDGLDDVIVGAHGTYYTYYSSSGTSYVVFGKVSGFGATLNLSELNGSNGFRLDGVGYRDYSGFSVSSAGDVNGDGFDDVIVGAPRVQKDVYSYEGASYIVFGKASGFDAKVELSSLDGNNGFRLDGEGRRDQLGISVSNVGDINGDGFDDLIVGASGTGSYSMLFSGASYVVFGKVSGFDATLDLSILNGSNGFRLDGLVARDYLGSSVSNAGDVNGDGFDDLIIIARQADMGGFNAGSGYVIFGKASGFNATMDLLSLDGNNGFRLDGWEYDHLGSMSGAGDVNGDGFDDLIVSVHNVKDYSNTCYVLLGKPFGFNAAVNLLNLTGLNGFRLEGIAENYETGFSVSSAGDVNGDGFDDLMIGSPGDSNSSYVVFGGEFFNEAVILGTSGEDILTGSSLAEHFEAGDGTDRLIGLGGADVFYGGNGTDTIIVPDLGFQRIEGGAGNDTLELAGPHINLKLADFHNTIKGIETFDLTGDGCVLMLTLADLRNLSNTLNTFTINGDRDDFVIGLNDGWEDKGNDGNYHIYNNQGTILQIETTVNTDRSPAPVFSLFSLNGVNGFRLDGIGPGTFSGRSVSSAGDVNGDGFDDVIIGVYAEEYGGLDSGSSYLVFGRSSGFDAALHFSNLDGNNGFRIDGKGLDKLGISVSNAGDINGDGFDDVIVGAPHAFIDGQYNGSGVSYVVLGKASGFDATMNMSSLNGSNGFRLIGGAPFDNSGNSVSNAGDVNGDGFDDLIISAPGESRSTNPSSSYVVFGQASGFDAQVNLSNLDGRNGFHLIGRMIDYYAGNSVSGAGDMNGDGFDDVIIGSDNSSYIVFGKASGFTATMDLTSLNGSNGFRLDGVAAYDNLGTSVSGAGDVNGDGFDDVVVGAPFVQKGAFTYEGASYIVFGKASEFNATVELSSLDGNNGFRLDGEGRRDRSGTSVSNAGDINGDGFDDLLIGAPGAGANGYGSGATYVVFGKTSGFGATLELSDLDGRNGFRVDGMAAYDGLGTSVSSAGDVNGDGFDDLIVDAPGADPNGNESGSSYIIFGRGGNVITGTPGDDVLKGTPAADIFEAGNGNDNLIGRGGADVFYGGAGDDNIRIFDLNFQLVDGGVGNDVLHLTSKDLNLDLTNYDGKISGIETICLYGNGDNALTLTAAGLLNLSDATNTLKVNGNSGDHIVGLSSGWVDEGLLGDGYFHVYTQGDAVLLVGANVMTDFM